MSQEMLLSTSHRGKSQIEELLRCIICFAKVKQPQMCPSCSKLCCNTCIKKWLTEQKSQCPHCRQPLRVTQLVNCRFVSDITAALESYSSNKKEDDLEVCNEHQAKLQYFCKTCRIPICADCAMFGTEHKNHEFEHITKIYEYHVDQVKNEAQGLKRRLKDLSNNLSSVEETIETVTKIKEEKATELQVVMEQINQRLESDLKGKLLNLLAHKSALTDEIEFLENMQSELNKQLSHSPKPVLIQKSTELIKMLREINAKPLAKFNKESIHLDFNSELVPNYDSAVFIMRNFSQIRKNNEVIYSEPLQTGGITWRLKVYPNGNGVAKGVYLSVFLEMVKGVQDSAKYEYKVEMINQRNSQIVMREFASDFETGECWGYNRFYKIELLEREGYLVPENDTIILKYFVRPPTYYQLCQDQRKYIFMLENAKSQAQSTIKELKDKLNQEAELTRRLTSSNPTNHNSANNILRASIKTTGRSGSDEKVLVEMKHYNNYIQENEESDQESENPLISQMLKDLKNQVEEPKLDREFEKYNDLFGEDDSNNFENFTGNLNLMKPDLVDSSEKKLNEKENLLGSLQEKFDSKESDKNTEGLLEDDDNSNNSLTLEELCEKVKAQSQLEQNIIAREYDNHYEPEEGLHIKRNLNPKFDEVHFETVLQNDTMESNFSSNIAEISENIMKKIDGIRSASNKSKEQIRKSFAVLTSGRSKGLLDMDKENNSLTGFQSEVKFDTSEKIKLFSDE